ncbi:kinetochore Sim4 complex subunit FTA2-domain-containing protein [Hypoxylon argillaceum]|nr:kinetochore Sim4 complex subunit FTA2-domain-containing protein [Hypoxylon argillaceum]
MARRGRPPKRGRSPKLDILTAKRRGPSKNHESGKTVRHSFKRGRPPKEKNKIDSPLSPTLLCPLPVIHPFKDQGASIEWGERLDAFPECDSEKKGFVFKVKINSNPYVLKIFKFFDPLTTKSYWSDLLGEEYPIEKAMVYTDPFYAECRAYGRIQEQADQGEVREKVATKCHGYMFLDEEAQRWLEGEGIDLGAESLTDELLPIIGGAGRPRAIVKEFEIAGPDLDEQTPQQIRKSYRSIKLLNQMGIYNRDVRAENFRNGWVVDFDTSFTLPHDIYKALPPFEARETRAEDGAKFEGMLREAGISMKFLPTKNFNLRRKLKEFK